jgi:hypothetical protein
MTWRVRPDLALFDRVVAENGALLYCPDSKGETILGERPPDRFIETLQQRGITSLSVGKVIVATRSPNESLVLNTIRDLGLELQVIFNKGAVMVLPPVSTKRAACMPRSMVFACHRTMWWASALRRTITPSCSCVNARSPLECSAHGQGAR